MDFVAGIVEEELFKLITSPTYFNEQIKWQDRRKLLIEICGDISDDEVFASDNQLKGLELILKGRSLEDHRKVVAERRKMINEDLKMIPVRIDEVNKSFPDGSIDIDATRKELAELDAEIDSNKTLIHNIQNGQALQSKELELKKVENDLETVKRSFETDSKEKLYQLQTKLQKEQGNLKILDMKLSEQNRSVDYANGNIKRIEEDLVNLRDEWKQINSQQFEHADQCICPTCEQDLPSDQVDAARLKALESFNAKKATNLSEIDSKGMAFAENKKQYLTDIDASSTQIEKIEAIRSEKKHR